MAISLVAVGQKWTATIANAIIAAVNGIGTTAVTPTSVAGTGVSLTGAKVVFSGSTSVSVNGCFTSTYDSYRVEIEVPTRSGVGQIQLLVRLAGTDAATTYSYQRSIYASTTPAASKANAVVQWNGMANADATSQRAEFRFINPAIAVATGLEGRFTEFDASGFPSGGGNYHGAHNTATAYDGFTLKSNNATTMTGTIRIFGITNS
jgi:hypothetical protein